MRRTNRRKEVWMKQKKMKKKRRKRRRSEVSKHPINLGKTPLQTGSTMDRVASACKWGVGGEWELGCRDLTTDGESQSRATHLELTVGLAKEGLKVQDKMGRYREKKYIFICTFILKGQTPTMAEDPAASCSASASVTAAADPPVSKQAERDSDSETHTFPIVSGDRKQRGGTRFLLTKKNFFEGNFPLTDSRGKKKT